MSADFVRTDLIVTHAEKATAAALASTGEQKALLTALALAHAELGGQCWLSGTDAQLFTSLDAASFTIVDGGVAE